MIRSVIYMTSLVGNKSHLLQLSEFVALPITRLFVHEDCILTNNRYTLCILFCVLVDVMVRVLASSVVDHGFEPRSGQTRL